MLDLKYYINKILPTLTLHNVTLKDTRDTRIVFTKHNLNGKRKTI